LFEYGLNERYTGIYAILDDPTSPWWDDIATVDVHETRDDIVVLAASDAVLNLRLQFGDRNNWNWDRLHAARFAHALSGGGALLSMVFDRGPVPLVGSTTSVLKTAVNPRKPYGVTDISSYRQIIEAGAWDRTLAINTTGQSGHVRSPHYFDQNAMWAAGQYRPFPFSRVAVDRGSVDRLLLTP
jgi:penicillin amidase